MQLLLPTLRQWYFSVGLDTQQWYERAGAIVHLTLEPQLWTLNNLRMYETEAVHCITHRRLCAWCDSVYV